MLGGLYRGGGMVGMVVPAVDTRAVERARPLSCGEALLALLLALLLTTSLPVVEDRGGDSSEAFRGTCKVMSSYIT